MLNLLRTSELASWPDPNTDQRLLPGFMRQEENDEEMRCYQMALEMAMDSLLTREQRQVLHMRFWLDMSVAEISGKLGISSSGVSKRVSGALEVLRRHVGFCVEVHAALLKEER